jgi:hypothetical protein
MHGPFVPFNIVFTHAAEQLDVAELARLDRFAASLQPDTTFSELITHPYRLYQLLCKGARLYFHLNRPSTSTGPSITNSLPEFASEPDFVQLGMDVTTASIEYSEAYELPTYNLSDWYQGNQQIMSLFEEDVML